MTPATFFGSRTRALALALLVGAASTCFAFAATAQSEPGAPAQAEAPAADAAPAPGEPAAAPAATDAAPAAGEAAPAATDAAAAAAPAAPAEAPAPAPVQKADKGDTAWLLVSAALVIFMTLPGLALFYGGLVRSKNVLSILMQCLVVFSVVAILWAVYGYSLAFTGGNAFIGGGDRLFGAGLNGAMAATFTKGVYLPELAFFVFQGAFACITCALIVGAFAERVKFAGVLLFTVIWFTFAYAPMAHMVWFFPGPDAFTDAKAAADATAIGVLVEGR